MEESDKSWFPVKRFGWGWGPPNTWEGWAVLIGYIAAVAFISIYFSPDRHPLLYPMIMVLATCVLIGTRLKKGEPPGWRWAETAEGPKIALETVQQLAYKDADEWLKQRV